MSQENKNIEPPSQEKLSFWKASLVRALRGTIGLLETTAVKLETEPLPGSEERSGFLQKIQQVWIGILGKIRLILPARFSAKLSDTALTGIISGLTVMIFLITSNAFDSKPSHIAIVPLNTEIPQVVSTTEPESIVSEQETVSEPQVEIPPLIEQTPLPTEEETVSKPQVETPPLIEQTPLPTEEETVSKPEIETPAKEQLETTLRAIPLTPEETLIVAIQNQLGEINVNSKASNFGNQTFSEIIESIQANFLNSNLTIKISNDWYSLEKNQQNKLAAEILQRSQELDFTHLEITDPQGKLIARNPVVGTEMIIFKR
jgi:hypothetical protein